MAAVITRLASRRVFSFRPKCYVSQRYDTIRFSVSAFKDYRRNSLCSCNEPARRVQQYYYFSTDHERREPQKSIFQRFKEMYKSYWYVLVPVHLATSACWFGGFYYLAKSGIDIVAFLESWNLSERITNPLKDSSMGYIAISYALYKIATPFRYTVTLGGTTVSINYLKKWGYIKPVGELKEMYKVKKENLMYSMKDKSDELKLKREKLKLKGEQLKDQTDQLLTKIKDKGGVIPNLGKEVKK